MTYTLNVANVSDYEFRNLVLIDRMPEVGDTGVVNTVARDSAFQVVNDGKVEMTAAVNGKEIPADLYAVTYSGDTEFDDDDFDNVSTWDDAAGSGTKSFRIAFADDFTLDPGRRDRMEQLCIPLQSGRARRRA